MAIKRSSKVETSFGASAMTDMMFLLLVFLIILTTLINSNALDILLPKSSNKVSEKATVEMSVTQDLQYYIDGEMVDFEDIDGILMDKRRSQTTSDKPLIMLSIDKRVTVDEMAKIMNLAKDTDYALFMMTTR